MATYYVKTTGNDTTGDGSEGNPWATPGKLAASMADNDLGYVQSGTYNLSTTTPGAGGPMTFPSGARVRIEGYETTAGDGCPTGGRPVLHANGNAPTQMVLFAGDFDDSQVLAHFAVNGDSQTTNGVVGNANGMRWTSCVNVLVQDCNGTHGFTLVHAVSCYSFSNSGIGFSNCQTEFCVSKANGGDGFDMVAAECSAINCIAIGNTIGFDAASYHVMSNCVAYGNSSDGFELSFDSKCVNCIAEGNGAYGFDDATATSALLVNCASYNNTTARSSNTPHDISAVTLSGSPFTNAAGDDFTLNNTAGAGAACRNAGIGVYGQSVIPSIGATEPAASGGLLTHPGMSGRMNG